MQYELKKIDSWSVIRIVFIVSLVLGFGLGLFYALILGAMGDIFSELSAGEFGSDVGAMKGPALLFFVFIVTVFVGVFNTILATVIVWLYNIIARTAGGIMVHIDKPLDELSPDEIAGEEQVL